MDLAYTGISFPFRISSKGGVSMSTTSQRGVKHIEESIQQILGTYFAERPMEFDIYSDLDTSLFEPNNATLQQVLRVDIVDAISRIDDRIDISTSDISFDIVEENGISFLYVILTYRVNRYDTYYSSSVKLGEVNNE